MTTGAGPHGEPGRGDGGGHATGTLGHGDPAPATAFLAAAALAAGAGLGRPAALQEMGRDARLRLGGGRVCGAAPALGGGGGRSGRLAGVLPLGRGRLGARSSSHRLTSCDQRAHHSGPDMPPSLRTRQKWMAMKMTITNGSMSTWRTYQRRSVSEPISTPPRSTKRTWLPKTGV